jgi:hypothetical protein
MTHEHNATVDLMEKLELLDKNTHREHFLFKDTKFGFNDSGKFLAIGDNEVHLGKDSFAALCGTLDIPTPYASRCPQDEQARMLNFWMGQRKDIMHSALITNDEIRSFMDAKYTYVPTARIFGAISDMLPEDFLVGNYGMQSGALEAQIFSPEYTQDVVDSEIRGGLRMVYSDAWTVAPKFDTYLYRVRCTNGLVSPIAGRKFRVAGKSEMELIQQVREYVAVSLDQMPNMFAGFLDLELQKVDNWIATVRKICLENKLPKKVADILVATADMIEFKMTIRGGIHSMHDVVNLFTYVATHNQTL